MVLLVSGADLANLVNEAALFAARGNKRVVSMVEFEKAKDKIMMGAERRSMVMTEAQKESTAYHEAGHAIIGRLVPEHDPVHKVTIIPRGRALGVTFFCLRATQSAPAVRNWKARFYAVRWSSGRRDHLRAGTCIYRCVQRY